MWNWFTPKCPLDIREKTWLEWRMRWLADRLGIDRLLKASVLLPTNEAWPQDYQGSLEDVSRMMEIIAAHMHVDISQVKLEICREYQLPNAAGHYDASSGKTIRLNESELSEPSSVASTIAHELSHEILLGGGLIDPDTEDHEWVTDLLTVYLGVGLFSANDTVRETNFRMGHVGWWGISKRGYMPSRMFGYGLALFAFMRGEKSPEWAKLLRHDAYEPLTRGIKFLKSTTDSLFHPDTIQHRRDAITSAERAKQLQAASASVRIDALWSIREMKSPDNELVTFVADAANDHDPTVSSEAIRTLGSFGTAIEPTLPILIRALADHHAERRQAAASSLGMVAEWPESVVANMRSLLNDSEDMVAVTAARALTRFGSAAESCTPQILERMRKALIQCDHPLVDELIVTLSAVSSDPRRKIEEFFAEIDEELSLHAVSALKRYQRATRGDEVKH